MMSSQPNSPLSPPVFAGRPTFGPLSSQRSLSPTHPSQKASQDASQLDEAGSDSSDDGGDEVHLTSHAGPSSSSYAPRASYGGQPSSPWHATHQSSLSSSAPRSLPSMDRTRPSRPPHVLGSPSSPIAEKSSAALRAVGKSLRRMNMRIVEGRGLGDDATRGQALRLSDVDESDGDDDSVNLRTANVPSTPSSASAPGASTPLNAAHAGPLVGKSLGLFGPDSRMRCASWRLLRSRWFEPAVLILIILQVALLIVQAERPQGTRDEARFFRRWEDYVLLAIFVCYTLEAGARILVTGLLLDPFTKTSLAAARDLASTATSTPAQKPAATSVNGKPLKAVFKGAVRRLTAVLALTGTTSEHARRREEAQAKANDWQDDSDDGDVVLSIAPLEPTPPVQPPNSSIFKRQPKAADAGQTQSFIASKLASTLATSTIASSVPLGMPLSSVPPPRTISGPSLAGKKLPIEIPFSQSLLDQRRITALGRPYLRNSWQRLDALAIFSFWVSLGVALAGLESSPHLHLYIFRCLSVLRTARLLLVTSGTATILHSLKRARHLILRVLFFLAFGCLLFAIVGIQAFSGSFRRSCYLIPADSSDPINLGQICGGWFDPLIGEPRGAVMLSNLTGSSIEAPKGFICPPQQICAIDQNAQVGQTFDQIVGSSLQTFIVATANGWSPVMYNMMDAEHFGASVFFICALLVLNYWLAQGLLVATVVSSFQDVRAESGSAFVSTSTTDQASAAAATRTAAALKPSRLRKIYEKTDLFWAALVVASIAAQATISGGSSSAHLHLVDTLRLTFAILFGTEILIRVAFAAPNDFGALVTKRNAFDLVLAVIGIVIELPGIQHTRVHDWLMFFPLARWYRVILAVPRMKPLLLAVFGNLGGMLNMTAFLGIMLLIAAIIAVQLIQNEVANVADEDTVMTFESLYLAALGMYQVLSSEDWTTPLFEVMSAEWKFRQAVISGIYFCGWIVFAYFVMLPMFVAVLQEGFSVAESAKRQQQLELFVRATTPKSRRTWLDVLNPYRLISSSATSTSVKNLPPALVLPLQKTIVRDRDASHAEDRDGLLQTGGEEGVVKYLQRKLRSNVQQPSDYAMDDLSSRLARDPTTVDPEEIVDDLHNNRTQMQDYILRHPSYDTSLFLFRQRNPLRTLCQKLVVPPGGERLFGRPPSPSASIALKLVVFLSIIASIVIAAVATPSYRLKHYHPDGTQGWAWFDVSDAGLAVIFVAEFCIKICADGFVLGPNAYLRNPANAVDGTILVCLLVNAISTLTSVGGSNAFTRALKAVRVLRLLTFSPLRQTFSRVIWQCAAPIMDAAALAVLYLIPYAVWGVIMFRNLLYKCNADARGRADCIGEYLATPVDGVGSGFPVPQVWANPEDGSWAFDDFRQSILILFEIVSLEGWIDVMESAMNVAGEGLQPKTGASAGDGLFFVAYNLFGAVIILTLFVTIIIQNFSAQSGTALLVREQRHWVDLKLLIARQRPARRPEERPTSFRGWCFDRAVQKQGWWARTVTAAYLIHFLVLITQTYGTSSPGSPGEIVRDIFYLAAISIFALDLLIRLLGLGWSSFKTHPWSLFNTLSVAGAAGTTLISLSGMLDRTSAGMQLQKVFLVALAMNLITRSTALNQFFKTAAASLPTIGSLALFWLVLLVFWALCLQEIFGLTKLGNNETRYANFRDILSSLVMLSVYSSGEGWNSYMHDFTISPPRCTASDNYLKSDCGSAPAAFGLLIAFNVTSMYILVNVITGAVVESFSYVMTLPGQGVTLDREQMRAFKRAWAEVDVRRTGRITKDQFATLFGKLNGTVLEVRPSPSELSVRNLLNLCKTTDAADDKPSPFVVRGRNGVFDIRKLNRLLDRVDYAEIRRRRRLYEQLYQEALLADEGGHGITFTAVLVLLAHYLLIDDEKALLLDELLRRRETTDQVQVQVHLERIKSLILNGSYRRRKRASQQRRMTIQSSADGMPAIVLDPTPSQPLSPSSPADLDSPSFSTSPLSRYHLEDHGSLNADFSPRRSIESSAYTRRSSTNSQILDDTPDPRDNSLLVDKMTKEWGDMLTSSGEE